MRAVALGLFLVAARCSVASTHDSDLQSMYEAHRWFALRDAIADQESSLLHRAAVALAFDDSDACEREVERLLASGAMKFSLR